MDGFEKWLQNQPNPLLKSNLLEYQELINLINIPRSEISKAAPEVVDGFFE